jgi:hypothetical protein
MAWKVPYKGYFVTIAVSMDRMGSVHVDPVSDTYRKQLVRRYEIARPKDSLLYYQEDYKAQETLDSDFNFTPADWSRLTAGWDVRKRVLRETFEQLVANQNPPEYYSNPGEGAQAPKAEILAMIAGDPFFSSYFEAALWASTDDDGEPLDRNYDVEDFTRDALTTLLDAVVRFYAMPGVSAAITSGLGPDRAGHDFWLTREGHGAGFWDGDWPEPAATILTDAARKIGPADLYVYNGKIGASR